MKMLREKTKMYIEYLSYVFRHKWYVFCECARIGLYRQGIFHDMSKFRPSEFFPYARHFCSPERKAIYKKMLLKKGGYSKQSDIPDEEFDRAWLLHVHRNPHHWQYWVMMDESWKNNQAMQMPIHLLREMVCDWKGAAKAQGKKHKSELREWYLGNRGKMIVHGLTKSILEILIFEGEEGVSDERGKV